MAPSRMAIRLKMPERLPIRSDRNKWLHAFVSPDFLIEQADTCSKNP
jgi:hypothetical protein